MSINELHNFSHSETESIEVKKDSEILPPTPSVTSEIPQIAASTPTILDDDMSSTTIADLNEIPTKSWRKTIEKEEKKRKIVLPIANGQFMLDTLNVYTAKNKTNLKPEKYSVRSNSNFIKVNVLKN